ncbi:hypothetical protein RHMOL_Rhmol05G0230800 [Rhododendron molle]|uniref:Uncharacterized protein n=1 Tax=Rhododendron molle TaxID=49168 RepID=A0ACC0NUB2_RHOML|nr:hypothetical protein RHMOL_Rhmol05G0230800 [Rhododendron molle]
MAQVGSERAFDGSLSSCKEEEPKNNGRSAAADAGPTRAVAKNPAPERAAIVAFSLLLRNMLQKLMGFNSDRVATARTAEEDEGCEATGGRFCAGFRREIVVEGGQSKVGVDAMVETSKDDRGNGFSAVLNRGAQFCIPKFCFPIS